jgi:hypothetical protein
MGLRGRFFGKIDRAARLTCEPARGACESAGWPRESAGRGPRSFVRARGARISRAGVSRTHAARSTVSCAYIIDSGVGPTGPHLRRLRLEHQEGRPGPGSARVVLESAAFAPESNALVQSSSGLAPGFGGYGVCGRRSRGALRRTRLPASHARAWIRLPRAHEGQTALGVRCTRARAAPADVSDSLTGREARVVHPGGRGWRRRVACARRLGRRTHRRGGKRPVARFVARAALPCAGKRQCLTSGVCGVSSAAVVRWSPPVSRLATIVPGQ